MFKVLAALVLVLSSFQRLSSESPGAVSEPLDMFGEGGEAFQGLPEILDDLADEERERMNAFLSLEWKDPGIYKLTRSDSTLSLPEGYKMLIGEDVNKVWRFAHRDNENLEAFARDNDFKSGILFEIWNEGYISTDDWHDLDAKNLLESLREQAEAANRELGRTRVGRELHVIGWMQEPVFDKHTNTVYWSIEIESSEEGAVVISVAIRLGREGFVKLICIASKEFYVSGDGHFDAMLRSHSFDPGYRYQDYRTGDRIASYGIATLVAASVVGEMANATGATGILKILGAFIFAGIAAVLYKSKKIFKRKGGGGV